MMWILPNTKHTGSIVDRILQNRKIDDKDSFLNPSESHIHSALLLHDAEKAAQVIINAVKSNKKIFIHGDFDVDGVTATTIMWRFLYYDLKANVIPYIPDRFSEGYGLSESSIDSIINQGAELIITVDCGVKDIELVNKYSKKVDFIITDHHTINQAEDFDSREQSFKNIKIVGDYAISAKAKAVVHPGLEAYPFRDICGAAVSWKVCCAVNEIGNFSVDMMKYIDLVALGTVCDVMPMVDENRAIVSLGLERMKNTKHIGLETLILNAGVQKKDLNVRTLGFALGPRINAAGRMSHAISAVRLLSTESKALAVNLASELSGLNLQRQEITQTLLDLAFQQVENQKNNKVIFVHGEEWPEGIIGLIAGRLSQHFYKPVIVGCVSNNTIKASARSIPGFDISEALRHCSTLLKRFGGHNQAAGLQLEMNNLESFIKSINHYANENLTNELLIPKIFIDTEAEIYEIDFEVANTLASMEPFGEQNQPPVIKLNDIRPEYITLFGKDTNFIKFYNKNSKHIQFINFTDGQSFYKKLQNHTSFDLIGNVEINTWNGNEELRFRLIDMRPAKTENSSFSSFG